MATVMMLENVLASLALMETSVTHVPRHFLDFHAAKVFIYFKFVQKEYHFFITIYFMSFIECNCTQNLKCLGMKHLEYEIRICQKTHAKVTMSMLSQFF